MTIPPLRTSPRGMIYQNNAIVKPFGTDVQTQVLHSGLYLNPLNSSLLSPLRLSIKTGELRLPPNIPS